MIRPLLLLVVCATLLTGCLPAGPPPGADPTAEPTPAETLETPVTLPALVLPECADLYTAAEVLSLMGEGMVPADFNPAPENAAYGTQFDELRAELAAGDSLNCTWVLPASERGLTVSVMLATPEQFELVSSTLRASGSDGTSTGGESIIFAISAEETPESSPYTEAHYLSPEIWVSARDLFGSFAPALTQAAMDRMAELNPAYFGG